MGAAPDTTTSLLIRLTDIPDVVSHSFHVVVERKKTFPSEAIKCLGVVFLKLLLIFIRDIYVLNKDSKSRGRYYQH